MPSLSPLDTRFLGAESSTTFGHVGALLVLDPSTAASGQLGLADVRDVLEARLHLAPRLRQRLVAGPLGPAGSYWLDDPGFDLEFHLREFALPGSDSDEALAEQVARIHARPLDRTRPLWEMYLISGVADGRCALYVKVSSAVIDGRSGSEVLDTVVDNSPEPVAVEPPGAPWDPDPLPSRVELLERTLVALAREPRQLAQALPQSLPQLTDLPGAANLPGAAAISEITTAVAQLAANALQPEPSSRPLQHPPRTPLNGPITAHRRFAYASLPLADVQQVAYQFAVSDQDVLLALCTTALRRWLLDHDASVATPLLVGVAVPDGTDASAAGDGTPVVVAELPTHVGDAAERLDLVRESYALATEQRVSATPDTGQRANDAVAALSSLALWALSSLGSQRELLFNVLVSVLAGPQQPLYVAGARVCGAYPLSAISDLTGGLAIAAFDYDGHLDVGLLGCRELVPDVWHLAGYLRDALAELRALLPS